jgi:uncharacterized membrane protein
VAEVAQSLADVLRAFAQTLATLVEGVGVAIVAVAIALALWRYVLSLVQRASPFPPEGLRLNLGRSLALALEFLLGADILRTAVEPTWDEIARLAAIAAIRTGLNYFLQRELANEARRTADAAGTESVAPSTARSPTG